jgi:hypothetical protein
MYLKSPSTTATYALSGHSFGDFAAKNAGNSAASDSLTRADRTIVRTLVLERLNLLGDPFIQNRVRVVRGVYPKRWDLMDV